MKKAERKDRGSNGHPASLVFWGGNTIRNHTSANGLWSVTKRVEVDVDKRIRIRISGYAF